jgi:hypothetical protein
MAARRHCAAAKYAGDRVAQQLVPRRAAALAGHVPEGSERVGLYLRPECRD